MIKFKLQNISKSYEIQIKTFNSLFKEKQKNHFVLKFIKSHIFEKLINLHKN